MDIDEEVRKISEIIEDNKDEAIKKIKVLVDGAETFDDYIYITAIVCTPGGSHGQKNGLNDKHWGRELMIKQMEITDDSNDLSQLANNILDEEYLGDSELAKQVFKKMKDNASDLSGYENLLTGLCDAILRDETFKEDAIHVANETLKMCSSIEDAVLVIEAFIREDQINDHQKALEIINTFIDQVTTCAQHKDLGNFACQVGNKELGIQLLKKAEELCEEDYEAEQLVYVIEDLDKEWAKRIKDKFLK